MGNIKTRYIGLILLFLAFSLLASPIKALPVTAWSDIWNVPDRSYAFGVAYGGEHFYAVGSSGYGDGLGDMLIFKYDLDGNVIWYRKYDFFESGLDRGVDVVYSNGRVYITGWYTSGTNPKNVITVCLDEENGNVQWWKTWGYDEYDDVGKSVVVYDNYVYVAVQVFKPTPSEAWILKYDLNGQLVKSVVSATSAIIDLDVKDGKIYVAGASGDQAAIAIYDKDLNLLELKTFSTMKGFAVSCFYGIEVISEKEGDFVYVMEVEHGVAETIVAKLDSNLEPIWAVKIEDCDGQSLGVHFGFPVVVGYTNKGTPALRNFYMVKISPEGEIMYEKIWGGDGRDYLYGVAFCRAYICTVGVSDSYTASDSGIVWCLKAEYTLQVELPYEKLKWMVFFKGFFLPVGGGYGSGSATLPEADYAVVVDEKFEEEDTRWVFYKWSDGVEESAREIRLFEDMKLKALYKKQYKITVESEYGTATGSGWYDEGATATISVSPTQVQLEDNKIAVFKGWLRNGEYISGEPTLVVSVTEPATYTATWEVKTVTAKTYTVSAVSSYGSVSGTGTYEEGATATISIAPTVVDHGNGTKHVFEGWVKEGGLVSMESSYSFKVTEDVHLKAKWRTEYLVEVYSDYGEVSGDGWYEKGATATISVSPTEVEVEGETLKFKGWRLGEEIVSEQATYSFVVDSPKSFTAEWAKKEVVEEYTIELVSKYGKPVGAGTYPKGATVEISVDSVAYEKDGRTRYVFAGWYYENGTVASKEPTFKLVVSKDEKLYARWIVEYRVEVYSGYGTVSGAGWYRAGSEATIKVSPAKIERDGVQYVFKEWVDENGKTVSTSPTYTFTVEKPSSFRARWIAEREAIALSFNPIVILLIILLILVIIVLLIVILKRK